MLEIALVVLIGVATLVYWIVNSKYNYWTSKGVVQPPSEFLFGHFKDAYLGRTNNGLVIHNIYKSFPNNDAVGFYELLTPKLFVKSPELVQRVMATDFSSFHDNEFYVLKTVDPYTYRDPFFVRGEEWKSERAKISPLITQLRMKDIFPLMSETTKNLHEYIQKNMENNFEAKELASLFTMDNISNCVFGISSDCFNNPDAAFRRMGNLMMKEEMQSFWKMLIAMRLPKLRDILGIPFLPKLVGDFLDDIVANVVNNRVENNVIRNDLMQQMIKLNGGKFSKELVGLSSVFFIKGFETSSMTGGSSLYELAINPNVQDTLYEEIMSAFGQENEINMETLCNLPYLDKVFKETLRKHPAMFTYQRLCTKDISLEIDGKLVDIKQGTPVPVYSIHFDPQYYPNPEVFDPERFSEDNIGTRPSYTYMPFGKGPRICVGSRLAITQVKLFITHIVRKYKVLRTKDTPSRLTLDPGAFLVVPKESRWIKLQSRT